MEENSRERIFSERRIQRACRYVSDQWFPLNPALLSDLQTKLKEGAFVDRCADLAQEISKDFSLFTYCLRELGRMLRDEGVETPELETVVELFQFAGLARLEQILATPAQEISRHQLSDGSSLQVSRMQEALLSATTAELLCEKSGITPECGFDAALLRQLGFTLIAWNYPEVYQRAVSMLASAPSLDVAIAQILGYSPSLLALRLVRSWGLPPTLMRGFDDDQGEDQDETTEIVDGVGSVLASLCRIGEALARANNPEIYPTAEREWEGVRNKLEQTLGEEALETIQEHYEQHCLSYIELAPEIFRAGMLVNPEMQIVGFKHTSLMARNPFIERCRPHVRVKITSMYEALADTTKQRGPLSMLLHEVIPAAGFSGGAIYTIDPALDKLVPQTLIGVRVLEQPLPTDPRSDAFIAQAFRSETVLVREGRTATELGGDVFVAFSWAVGFSQRVGALYLEIPLPVYQQRTPDHMNHFNAILQALNDCLGLR